MSETQKVIKYCALALAFIIIVSVISGIIYGFSFVTSFFDSDESTTDLVRTEIESSIVDLSINVKATNLVIKEGEEFAVETNNKYINVEERSHELIIKEKNRTTYSSKNNDLIVYIPSDTEFDVVYILAGAGQLKIDTILTEKLDLELGAGNAEIEELVVNKKASIDGGVGKFEIKSGTIHNLDVELGVGKTEITAKLLESSTLEAGVGELKLNLIGSEDDYKIYAEKGIGAITIDGDGIKNESTIGDGENTIDIEGGIGSINIKFKKGF